MPLTTQPRHTVGLVARSIESPLVTQMAGVLVLLTVLRRSSRPLLTVDPSLLLWVMAPAVRVSRLTVLHSPLRLLGPMVSMARFSLLTRGTELPSPVGMTIRLGASVV